MVDGQPDPDDGQGQSPRSITLASGGQDDVTAAAYDQFGNPMSPQPPAPSWSVPNGIGTIAASGLYPAPQAAGPPRFKPRPAASRARRVSRSRRRRSSRRRHRPHRHHVDVRIRSTDGLHGRLRVGRHGFRGRHHVTNTGHDADRRLDAAIPVHGQDHLDPGRDDPSPPRPQEVPHPERGRRRTIAPGQSVSFGFRWQAGPRARRADRAISSTASRSKGRLRRPSSLPFPVRREDESRTPARVSSCGTDARMSAIPGLP